MSTTIETLQNVSAPSGQYSGLTASRLASGVDFFKLLTAQMGAQDPLQPVDNTQFLTQLAQYSQLQQSLTTNQTLTSIASLQATLSALETMTQTASLIGRTIDYTDPQSGESKTGNVKGVSAENGLVVLEVDGSKVPLTAVTAVRAEE
jgi:flagellar basal-body rod modification protein FlgD